VRLFNVASYLHAPEVRLEVPGIGELVIDLAYGGNFYAIVEPQALVAGLDAMSALDILRSARWSGRPPRKKLQRQPSAGATWVRIASMTCAL
jgi:4-hydroxyproline epimerase